MHGRGLSIFCRGFIFSSGARFDVKGGSVTTTSGATHKQAIGGHTETHRYEDTVSPLQPPVGMCIRYRNAQPRLVGGRAVT